MPVKTLIKLLALLAVLGAAAYVLQQRNTPSGVVEGVASGGMLLPDLDVNAVTSIEVADRQSTATVVRAEAGWQLAMLHLYPANFEPVAGLLRQLAEVKVGQVVRGGTASLADFGLDPGSADDDYVRLTLAGGSASPVILTLGALKQAPGASGMGMGMPQGRYVRVGEGPVVQVEETFIAVSSRAQNWIDQQLVQLKPADIAEFSVTTTGGTWSVRNEGGTYALDGLVEGEQVDHAAVQRLFEGLQWFRFDTVADPATTDSELGFDRADVVKAALSTGIVYTVTMGGATTTNGMRAVRVDVAGGAESSETASLQAKYQGWTYLVPEGYLTQLTPARSTLITQPPPTAEPESTSTPPQE